jgi:hypothetical protein
MEPILGKDCTTLFEKYHHFINGEQILNKCIVGYSLYNSRDSYTILTCKKIIKMNDDGNN